VAPSLRVNKRGFAVVGICVAVIMSIAVPLRALVQERRDISSLKQQISAQEASIKKMKADAVRLKDKAYLVSLARSRLNYVFPGEVGLVVIDQGTSTEISSVPGALVPNDTSAWYSKLWHSTELADQPHSQNDPLVIHDRASSK
jgi:cell division protein FtsB